MKTLDLSQIKLTHEPMQLKDTKWYCIVLRKGMTMMTTKLKQCLCTGKRS